MSLADNITYLANDKVSNVFGIINKRLQQHMARYSLELIHSEFLMDRYKDRKNLKEITLIDHVSLLRFFFILILLWYWMSQQFRSSGKFYRI